MFCDKCGNKLGEGDIFCGKCGWDSRTGAGAVKEESLPQEERVPREEGLSREDAVKSREKPLRKREIPQLVVLPPLAEGEFDEEDEESIAKLPLEEVEFVEVDAGDSTVKPTSPARGFFVEDSGESTAEPPLPNEDAPSPKRRPRGRIIGIAAVIAAVVMVLVLVLVNRTSIMNALKKNSSPQDYYCWVEGRALEDVAGMAVSVYEMYFLRSMQRDNIAVEAKAELSFGKEGKKLLNLAGMSGVDFSWAEDLGLSLQISSKDGVMGAAAQLGLKEDTIFDLTALFDTKEGMTYLQLGQLGKTYLGAEVENIGELLQQLEFQAGIYEALPGKGKMEELLLKYAKLALAYVDDVTVEEGSEISAGEVTQKCTQLTVRMDGDTLEEMALAVLEEMQQDRELKGIIMNVAEVLNQYASGRNADIVYADFQETIGNLCRRIEWGSYMDSDTEIIMKVYVDADGKICGRSIEREQQGTIFEFFLPQDGEKFGLLLSTAGGEAEEFALAGKGSVLGTSYSGEFSVLSCGSEVFSFEVEKVDTAKWKKGLASGTFRIPLSYVLGEPGLYDIKTYLRGLTLTLKFLGEKDSMRITCGIGNGKEEWGSVVADVKIRAADRMGVPSGKDVILAEGPKDIWNYRQALDWNAYEKKLSETALPSEFVELVGEVAREVADELYGIVRDMMEYGKEKRK